VRSGGPEVASWRQQDWVTCVDFHPTSDHLIFSSDKSVHTWDIRRNGSLAVTSSHRHRKLVSRFRVDPLRLVSCSLDGCVKASSLEDPCVRRASPHATPSSSPSLGPSTPPVALGNVGFIDSGSDTCTLRTSTDYVLCIDFDGTRLLTGGVNGRINAYDFSDSGNFRLGSPSASPVRHRCGQPVDFHLSGLQEIEVH
jgi:WD40 repeat protein